eukprot:TRINITY_DN95836_c0_g1_i1.p1 TRINITY_DN95836_c0_g1~~TRINITY_DN95836_c0_g1_i1.p1  ORF type:complete len:488 (-),score=48.51 TRINITY_DN95836_c0_g1_i1:91-1485(-)
MGAFFSLILPVPVTTKAIQRVGNKRFRVATASMNGYRTNMEDYHCVVLDDNFGFWGVFDGHSGSECSAHCATAFPRAVRELARSLPLTDQQLIELTLQVDEQFLRVCRCTAGSTATFCIGTPSAGRPDHIDLQVGNVGDSRVVVGRKVPGEDRWEARPLTVDHKPTTPDERRRIERCGGFVEANRVDGCLNMSRCMGNIIFKRGRNGPLEQKVIALPDVTHFDCGPEDFLLLACDGIFEGRFSTDEVVQFVARQLRLQSDPGVVAAMLCDEALRRGSTDNMTAMIVLFEEGSQWNTAAAPGAASGPTEVTEIVPGPYYHADDTFRATYRKMAERFGVSLERCLELRYDNLQFPHSGSSGDLDQDGQIAHSGPHAAAQRKLPDTGHYRCPQFADVWARRRELEFFRTGPPVQLEGAARTRWFAARARSHPSGSVWPVMRFIFKMALILYLVAVYLVAPGMRLLRL